MPWSHSRTHTRTHTRWLHVETPHPRVPTRVRPPRPTPTNTHFDAHSWSFDPDTDTLFDALPHVTRHVWRRLRYINPHTLRPTHSVVTFRTPPLTCQCPLPRRSYAPISPTCLSSTSHPRFPEGRVGGPPSSLCSHPFPPVTRVDRNRTSSRHRSPGGRVRVCDRGVDGTD